MLKIILPVILAFAGTGAGIGAAKFLSAGAKSEASKEETAVDCVPAGAYPDAELPKAKTASKPDEKLATSEFVKLNNQFVVPIVSSEKITALVVLGLSIEVAPGNTESVYSREPKLRDAFLQVLFDHANVGGFDGTFTKPATMDVLRNELRKVARGILGATAMDVLITEIARQDAI